MLARPDWALMSRGDKLEALSLLVAENLSTREIAARFEGASRNAIIGFCGRWGVTLPNSRPGDRPKTPAKQKPRPVRPKPPKPIGNPVSKRLPEAPEPDPATAVLFADAIDRKLCKWPLWVQFSPAAKCCAACWRRPLLRAPCRPIFSAAVIVTFVMETTKMSMSHNDWVAREHAHLGTIARLTAERDELAALYKAASELGDNNWRMANARAAAAEDKLTEARRVVGVTNDAIAEYIRYLDGGEMRGSYDGKPERNGLRKAHYAARSFLASKDAAP